ncbi:hypothetical protein J6Q66_07840 [bacterium]|nr:hypothetical protein [bacterium]
MYIIELLIKKFREREERKRVVTNNQSDGSLDYEKCDHVFMPIDSTGKIFACSKCGEILKKE